MRVKVHGEFFDERERRQGKVGLGWKHRERRAYIQGTTGQLVTRGKHVCGKRIAGEQREIEKEERNVEGRM